MIGSTFKTPRLDNHLYFVLGLHSNQFNYGKDEGLIFVTSIPKKMVVNC